MNIVIIGIGAMGSLFGAYLHPLAHVTLLGEWAEQLQTLQRDGLWLEDPHGRRQRHPLQATHQSTAVPPADVALILVKSHKTAAAASLAKRLLTPNGIALTLQNGLGNLETLTAVLGPDRAALGITSAGATMLGPGQLRVASQGHTYLASQPATAVRLTHLARLLQQAGFPTELTPNGTALAWGKLAVNAGINPLTALLGQPNGYLLQHPIAQQLMMAAAQETAVVAHALGIQLPYADAGQQVCQVAQLTANNYSSMLQDVLRGVTTEIAAINGQVVAHGRRLHIPTPVNQLFLDQIKQLPRAVSPVFTDPNLKLAQLQAQINEELS